MPPRLSIVTVTWNAREHLAATLKSVLGQTFRDLEWLLIDGGSKDGTVAKAQELCCRSWLEPKVVSEPDKGIYDAMNKGLDRAQGDYVLFLNAGDELVAPDTLERLFAQERVEDVLYAPLVLMRRGAFFKLVEVPETLAWQDMLRGMVVSHQGILFARHVAPRYDLAFRYTSDHDWCLRGLKACETRYRHDQPVVRYQGGGVSEVNFVATWKDSLAVLRRHFSPLQVASQAPRFAYQWLRYGYHRIRDRKPA